MTRRARQTTLLLLAVFAASCVVGPLLDQIHVLNGTLSYAHPWLFGQAWWVGPQFGLAFAGLAGGSLAVQHWLGRRAPEPTPAPRVLQQLAWLLAAYVTTGLLWREPWLVVALLSGGLAIRVVAHRPDAASIRAIVVLAVLGTTYEATLASIPGTFDYTETAGLPAPPWLPLLYAHAGPLVRTFMKNATAKLRQASSN